MKKAGAVIGKGQSGFVIDPPIACADGRDMRGYVTRLPKDKEKSPEYPKDVLETLRKIDPDQKYFYYPLECVPGPLSEQNKKDGATEENKLYAQLFKKATSETFGNPKYRLRTWREWMEGRQKRILESTVQRTPPQIEHLKAAIKLLHDNHILHGDIHDGNVLMADDGLPRIIDFEFSEIADPSDPKKKAAYALEDSFIGYIIENRYIPTSKSRGGRKTRRRQKKKTRRLKLKH